MIRLTYTHIALNDLIVLYEEMLQAKGEVYATEGVETIVERCEDLARYPDMGRRRPDLDALGLQPRSVTQSGRLIVYVKRGNALYVVRVLRDA